MSGGGVNARITDSVTQADVLAIAQAPSVSMSMTYMVGATTIGMIMQNAVRAERDMQEITKAAVVTVCALIVVKGSGG